MSMDKSKSGRRRIGDYLSKWVQCVRWRVSGPRLGVQQGVGRRSDSLRVGHSRRTASYTAHRAAAGGGLIPGVLAVVVAGLMVAVGLALTHQPAGAAAAGGAGGTGAPAAATGSGPVQQVTCGGPGQAACAAGGGNVWIPLASTSSGDILAAVRKSTLFTEQRADAGDHVHDLSRLGTPLLVRALQPASGSSSGSSIVWPDFYVVPILDTHGNTTDAAEAQLNPSHSAIHVIAIVTYTAPRPEGAIAALPASVAVRTVEARAHTALRAGTEPQLVYFAADAAAQESGAVVWRGGGEFPADPIWLVAGADGQEHVVGDDGVVYSAGQLPMMHG